MGQLRTVPLPHVPKITTSSTTAAYPSVLTTTTLIPQSVGASTAIQPVPPASEMAQHPVRSAIRVITYKYNLLHAPVAVIMGSSRTPWVISALSACLPVPPVLLSPPAKPAKALMGSLTS